MVLCQKFLIQCKICYICGTDAFYLLYSLVNTQRFQNDCHFLVFFVSVCPKITHRHIFVMLIIAYVRQNSLRAFLIHFLESKMAAKLKNGRHFIWNGILTYALVVSRFSYFFHYVFPYSTKMTNIFHLDSYTQIRDGHQLQITKWPPFYLKRLRR